MNESLDAHSANVFNFAGAFFGQDLTVMRLEKNQGDTLLLRKPTGLWRCP